MGYRLSRNAENDLVELYVRGIGEFGLAQTDRYRAGLEEAFAFLAEFPRAARERVEITPPVRAHPYKSNLIVYVLDDEDVLIVGRHGREDWMTTALGDA